jgi:hypothetical protein
MSDGQDSRNRPRLPMSEGQDSRNRSRLPMSDGQDSRNRSRLPMSTKLDIYLCYCYSLLLAHYVTKQLQNFVLGNMSLWSHSILIS